MTFDDKIDLINKAYDAIRELRDALYGEKDIDNGREASDICRNLMLLEISISADEHDGK